MYSHGLETTLGRGKITHSVIILKNVISFKYKMKTRIIFGCAWLVTGRKYN